MFWRRASSGPIGLIAGQGEFPLIFAQAAAKQKQELVLFGLKGYTDPRVELYAKEVHYVELGALGRLVELIKQSGVRRAVIGGGVPKTQIVNPEFSMDRTARGFIDGAKRRGDDKLLRAFELFLRARCGITIVDPRIYLKDILAKRGVMTRRKPTREESKDLKFGQRMAKRIGKLDIGQAVVVKSGVVLAVEAVEGTDKALMRGGELGHGGAVAVKVSKPGQDLRFDLPTVGPETVTTMKAAGIGVLGIEAGKTLVLSRPRVVEEADRAGLTIVGL